MSCLLHRASVACLSLAAVLSTACSDASLGDIAGPLSAGVGETVVITSEGTLRSTVDDVTMLSLLGYDGAHVLGEIVITKVELEGGTELADQEEPPTFDDGFNLSNVVHIRHDQGTVTYQATAEVTCVAAGEVVSAKRPAVLFGLEWMYDDGDSGGNLNREIGDHPFSCEE